MKTPFAYFPLKSTSGRLLGLGLTALYGGAAGLRMIPKIARHRGAFFAIKDREGANRPAILDKYGEHRFVNLKKAGIKLHYVSAGDDETKPLMLFVHGFPECWFSWRHQMKAFSGDYHTVAVNMRGYGESDKPKGVDNYSADTLFNDLVEFIQTQVAGKKTHRKVILVSHDWGGIIAWNVAQHRPDLVDRFIALNAPHPKAWQQRLTTSWKQFHSSWYMFFFNCPTLPELYMRARDFRMLDVMFGPYSKDPSVMDAYKHYFAKPYGLQGPLNYYRAMFRVGIERTPSKDTQKNKDKRVQPKTLIVWGKDDDALVSELATDSAEHCKNATVKYLDRCSHWIMIHRPDEVNETIRRFLKQ